mmetsp:Transcript_13768/g.33644  ORF Transcript_13768/g.33644 Transcript_13768/m.33644 type:complete len:406 (-) Transcript_13768:60-1277(-)
MDLPHTPGPPARLCPCALALPCPAVPCCALLCPLCPPVPPCGLGPRPGLHRELADYKSDWLQPSRLRCDGNNLRAVTVRMEVREGHVDLRCHDGFLLKGTLFERQDSGDETKTAEDVPAVLISSATGTRRWFYAAIARHLASLGCVVLTYDYRGIGDSLPLSPEKLLDPERRIQSLKEDISNAGISSHWGEVDQTTAIRFLQNRYPSRELCLIAHSVGGHISSLTPLRDKIKRIVFINVHNAHPSYAREPLLRWGLAYLLPIVSRVLGYFPMKRMGWMEDLPKAVAEEWSDQMKCKDYCYTTQTQRQLAAAMEADLLAISTTDDEYCKNLEGFEHTLGYYPNCNIQSHHLSPHDVKNSGGRLGHMGFFRSKFKQSLWMRYLDKFIVRGHMGQRKPSRAAKLRSNL